MEFVKIFMLLIFLNISFGKTLKHLRESEKEYMEKRQRLIEENSLFDWSQENILNSDEIKGFFF